MARIALMIGAAVLALSACTGADGPADSSPSGSPRPEGTPGDRAWADLPVGAPPKVPYVHGHDYISSDGEVRLPPGRRGVSGVVPFSGGLLVSDENWFEGTNGLDLVKDGERVESWPSGRHCSSGHPVASPGGHSVAWITLRCPESLDRTTGTVHRARADGSDEVTQPIGPGLASVVGFFGHSVVYNAGLNQGAWIADFDSEPRRIPGVDSVQSLSERAELLVGQLGDRARLVMEATGSVRWRAESGDLVAFSPNGKAVLALHAGRRVVVLHTRDGLTAADLDLPAGTEIWSTVWETNRTLLTLLRHGQEVAVLRLYLDGRIERATPPASYAVGPLPYVLLEEPITSGSGPESSAVDLGRVSRCSNVPLVPAEVEVNTVLDFEGGQLQYDYIDPEPAHTTRTFVIDFIDDPSCRSRNDTFKLINHALAAGDFPALSR